jgi:hypothetical protein
MAKMSIKQLTGLIDREEALAKELDDIPEEAFLLQADEFAEHIRYSVERYTDALQEVRAKQFAGGHIHLRAPFRRARFYLFAVASTPLAIATYFYEESKRLWLYFYEAIHELVDAWKHSGEVLLVTQLRHRVQHGGILEGIISVHDGTEHPLDAPEGPVAVRRSAFELSEKVWESAIQRIQNADDRERAKTFHTDFLAAADDPVGTLLRAYAASLDGLVGDIGEAVSDRERRGEGDRLRQDLAAVRDAIDDATVDDD